jgi:hypothetical protein
MANAFIDIQSLRTFGTLLLAAFTDCSVIAASHMALDFPSECCRTIVECFARKSPIPHST